MSLKDDDFRSSFVLNKLSAGKGFYSNSMATFSFTDKKKVKLQSEPLKQCNGFIISYKKYHCILNDTLGLVRLGEISLNSHGVLAAR